MSFEGEAAVGAGSEFAGLAYVVSAAVIVHCIDARARAAVARIDGAAVAVEAVRVRRASDHGDDAVGAGAGSRGCKLPHAMGDAFCIVVERSDRGIILPVIQVSPIIFVPTAAEGQTNGFNATALMAVGHDRAGARRSGSPGALPDTIH